MRVSGSVDGKKPAANAVLHEIPMLGHHMWFLPPDSASNNYIKIPVFPLANVMIPSRVRCFNGSNLQRVGI